MLSDPCYYTLKTGITTLTNRTPPMAKQNKKPDFVVKFEQDESAYFDIAELEDIIFYYSERGDHKSALKAADLALKLHGNDPYFCMYKLSELLSLNKNSEILKLRDELMSGVEKNDDEVFRDSAWAIIAKATHLTGDDEAAVRIYERILENDNLNDVILYEELSEIHEDNGRIDEAINVMEKAAGRFPDDADTLFNLALLYNRKEDHKKAIETWNKAIDIDAFDPVLWLNLGKEYMLDGNLEESVKALQYAHTLDPESRTINGLLGAALARTENNFEAAGHLLSAASDDGTGTNTLADKECPELIMAADCYHNEGEFEKTADLCYVIINMRQETPYLICLLQDSLRNLGRYHEAVFILKTFMNEYPDEIDLPMLLGDIYHIHLSRPEEAVKMYEKALVIDPNETHALFASASCYLQMEKTATALDLFKLAAKTDTGHKLHGVYFMMAVCSYLLGHKEDAMEYLKQQSGINDNHDYVKLFLKTIPEAEQLLVEHGILKQKKKQHKKNT